MRLSAILELNSVSLRFALCAIAISFTAMLALPQVALAQDPCAPPNVIPASVCNFDTFSGALPREMPDGWAPFVLSGDLEYGRDEHSFFGGGTLRMRNSGGTFKAGIYTQVGAMQGAGYRASLSWGAPNEPNAFGRQLGIDPTGGVDPLAATVIWGPMHWGDGRILNYPVGTGPNIDVAARAVSDRMTVFFLVDHPTSTGDNLIFVDALALYPDENAPAPIEVSPTPEPPTATPEPVAAAPVFAVPVQSAIPLAPTATATPLPTDTPKAEPTATPTATPTETPIPTSTLTLTPTWTPWPTATSADILSMEGAQERFVDVAQRSSTGGLAALGGLSLMGALIFGASLWWLRRKK